MVVKLMKSIVFSVITLTFAGAAAAADVPGATTIDAGRANQLFQQQILFVDVRGDSDWDAGRVAGADHVSAKGMSKERLLERVDEPDNVFIIYGNSPNDKAAADAVAKAVSWGFTKVMFYQDGFVDWKSKGHPVE